MLNDASTSELMALADEQRRARHGGTTYYVHSYNLNPTNLCENRCKLCAFWREREAPTAYVLTLEEARKVLIGLRDLNLTDLHVVGGIIPELNLEYYERLMRLAKEILPGVLVQGMTAVEIHWLADRAGLALRDVLIRLHAAGLGALSGGGAEIFAASVRDHICTRKIPAEAWLTVHETAHQLGIPTNATMLFGHLETSEDLIDHLSRLRALQDRTGGFQAFIPLPFHPAGTQLGLTRGPSGDRIARVAALARLFLDNVPHVRMLVNYVDRKVLGALTHGGVDDIGGTSLDERIAKAAGAPDRQRFSSPAEMAAFIRSLRLQPVLTNSVYAGKPVPLQDPTPAASPSGMEVQQTQASCRDLLSAAGAGKRLTAEEAEWLHEVAPLGWLGSAALQRRRAMVAGQRVTYVLDRNQNVTNICETKCKFCAFHVTPESGKGFVLSIDDVAEKVRAAAGAGATQILLQGGINPACGLAYYEELFIRIRKESDIWIHSLSPTEIVFFAKQEHLPVRAVLERLMAAGLQSLPGGGAEILVDEVRARVSPGKATAGEWFEVMETAHGLGLKTTATMVYGLGETTAHRVEHLMRVRDLQDRTQGFTAFIPWSLQSNRTALELPEQTGADYLRMVALARLVLDNVPHLQAGWVTEGPDAAQLALSFGADDFGGVLMEEQVVRATGVAYAVTADRVRDLIRDAGWIPTQRTTQYGVLS
jgi:dehypoxanthine futalosine cyclase